LKQTAICLAIILFSCRSLVTTYEDVESANSYTASPLRDEPQNVESLIVMTWNIRFGAARIPFFGDSCGDRVLMTQAETEGYLNSIVDYINSTEPDILLLQEVDISSKRSAYVNQLQYILDRTHLNYGAYASMWNAEIIPSDGLGRVDAGNAVLSRWEITDAERIQLPLRTDQDALTQYFYLRRNILKAKIALPIDKAFYAVNIHATAFATDDTKQKHIARYKEVLDDLDLLGATFVTGGDLNSVPPSADSTDFCYEDMCNGESFHADANGGPHKEGSYFENFTEEPNLIKPFYQDYFPAIDTLIVNNAENFTHSPWNENRPINDTNYWDRKLDYLFTNIDGFSNGKTHQEAKLHSDHAPVSATLTFP